MYHPNTGVEIGRVTPLIAEFGKHGGERRVELADGTTELVADIVGHYFSSAAAQDANGWSDEERESVEQTLLRLCVQRPDQIRLVEAARVEVPWPSYLDTHHKRIPALAAELGLLGEAIAYEEQQAEPRSGVIAELREKLALVEREQQVEAELTVA